MIPFLDQWNQVGQNLQQALEQHTQQIANAKDTARTADSRSTVSQLAASSLGTQIDDAEKRVNRSIDRLERKLDALLRDRGLDPGDFKDV